MAQELCLLVKIAAVDMCHGCEGATEIMEAEVFDPGPVEAIFKISLHTPIINQGHK